MIKKYCDRCEKEIRGDVEYKVHLAARSDGPGTSTKAAYFNTIQNTSLPRIYCEECINNIQDFLNNRIEKTKPITNAEVRKKSKIGAIRFFKAKK